MVKPLPESTQSVLYARVSSKEQELEGYSIPAQLKLLREDANKRNLVIIKEFTDAETAKQAGRSAFNEMLIFLKANPQIKYLICEKTDRLSRNFRDIATLDDLMNTHGVTIILVKENVVLSKESRSHEKFIFGIKALMSKNYIDNLSEEVKKGLLEKAEQGEYPSTAPIGYKNNKETRKIEPREPQASIIQRLFKLYATGNYSLQQLRTVAKNDGLFGPMSKRYVSKSTIDRILKNPIYYGDFIWKGKLYNRGSHTPLITKTLFEAVQEVFAGFNKSKERKHSFPISGILTCSRCGCAIIGEVHKKKYTYYRCTHYRGKCGQPYVRAEKIDAAMLEIVRKAELDQKLLDWLKQALIESHEDETAYHEGQIAALRTQYDRFQRRIDEIYLDKLDGAITEDFWKTKTSEWRAEQNRIQEQLIKHQQANQNYMESGIRILELAKDVGGQYVRATAPQKRQILRILLSNCTLNDVTPSPTYRKPFCWIAEGPLIATWRPQRDSNPRHHRERVMS